MLAASTGSFEKGLDQSCPDQTCPDQICPDQICPSDNPHSVASLDDITTEKQYSLPAALHGASQPSEPQYRPASPTPGIPASQIQGVIAGVEDFLSQQYIVSSPRVDLLLTLIQFNVFRALVSNTFTLGFPFSWLSAEADSPYYLGESRWCCPASLQPTALQRKVPHHPWIDLFPFPALRDNKIGRASCRERVF